MLARPALLVPLHRRSAVRDPPGRLDFRLPRTYGLPSQQRQETAVMTRYLLALAWAAAGLLPPSAQAADKVKIGFISTLRRPGPSLGSAIPGPSLPARNLNPGQLAALPAEVLLGDDH